jgi:hypothetical protein
MDRLENSTRPRGADGKRRKGATRSEQQAEATAQDINPVIDLTHDDSEDGGAKTTKKTKKMKKGGKAVARSQRHLGQVDLTQDDDEGGDDAPPKRAADDSNDLIITGAQRSPERRVCFGRIYGKAHIHRIPQDGVLKGGKWAYQKVTFEAGEAPGQQVLKLTLCDGEGAAFGALTAPTAQPFSPLLRRQDVSKVDLVIAVDEFTEREGEAPGSAVSRVVDVEILVWGPRRAADFVGKRFSKLQFFFANPRDKEMATVGEYFNPHHLHPDEA